MSSLCDRDGSGSDVTTDKITMRFFRADQFDRLRVPVGWCWVTCTGPWGHIEPFAQWGKGLTARDELLDVRKNAVKRLCTHVFPDTRFVQAAFSSISADALDPSILDDRTPELKARAGACSADTELDWLPGRDLMSGRQYLVPALFVYYDYPAPRGMGLGRQTTDGLGAGPSADDATLDGLLSLVSGDAAAIVLRNRLVVPDVIMDQVPSAGLSECFETLRKTGISMRLKDFTNDLSIPTFGVLLIEESYPRGPFITHGYGSHPSKAEALARAVTEAVQWRSFYLKTLAELSSQLHPGYCTSRFVFDPRMKDAYGCMFVESREPRRYSEMPSRSDLTTRQAVLLCVERLRTAGRELALVVDLSRREADLAAVRVIVPGLQSLDDEYQATSSRLHSVPRILGHATANTTAESLYKGRLP